MFITAVAGALTPSKNTRVSILLLLAPSRALSWVRLPSAGSVRALNSTPDARRPIA
jgi:hypothetical protein